MKNNSSEIRNKFINYFTSKGHTYVVSSPILPPNDDKSLLFTNAGMVQFKDIFLGLSEPKYKSAVTSQKCIRAGGKHNDLDNVGFTNRHHTFFEMLGNFSFGDYFKHDAIKYAWDFLTNELKIPQEKLWITVHESDKDSKSIWVNEIGVEKDKISVINTNDNFWSMGDLGPCGPCTEIFYDFGSKFKGMPPGQGDEGDRFVEILSEVRGFKSENGKSLKEQVKIVLIQEDFDLISKCIDDFKASTQAKEVVVGTEFSVSF